MKPQPQIVGLQIHILSKVPQDNKIQASVKFI